MFTADTGNLPPATVPNIQREQKISGNPRKHSDIQKLSRETREEFCQGMAPSQVQRKHSTAAENERK